jgi:hypothetical protein
MRAKVLPRADVPPLLKPVADDDLDLRVLYTLALYHIARELPPGHAIHVTFEEEGDDDTCRHLAHAIALHVLHVVGRRGEVWDTGTDLYILPKE